MRILIVGDDPAAVDRLTVGLQLCLPEATIAHTDFAAAATPDVVVLLEALPGTGLGTLRGIRAVSDAPVLIMADGATEAGQVQAFAAGADDHVAHPIGALATAARLRALLRRAGRPDQLVVGELALDPDARRATLAGRPLVLTPTEYRLLAALAARSGHVVAHRELRVRVWGPDFPATDDNLKTLVGRLRATLQRAGGGVTVATERGLGYRLVAPGSAG